MAANLLENEPALSEDESNDDEEQQVEAWDDWESDGDGSLSDYLCLFCDSRFDSTETLFGHCKSHHHFDFRAIVKDLGLEFYGSMKLINYVRSQVVLQFLLFHFDTIFYAYVGYEMLNLLERELMDWWKI